MVPQWDAEKPIYLQLYQQVISRILSGDICEGESLPSVRKVAAEYQLNPLTVSKAYQMLQDEELVDKQRGKGLFVKDGVKGQLLARERDQFLAREWPAIVERITQLELSVETLLSKHKEAGS